MELRTFETIAPDSVPQARAAHGKDGAYLAGGTDLLGVLTDRIHATSPARLVDLQRLSELRRIQPERGGLRIGALVTLAELARHPAIVGRYPLLSQAARAVASPQIRNAGTLGGNLCQEVRCWYYRAPDNVFPCMRKGGATCNALLGENRYHSIFGAVRLGAPACADGCPAGVPIPRYLERLREGDERAALELILERNPLPAITGRVCPHFCEQACNRGLLDQPVASRAIERRLGDMALAEAARFYAPPRRNLRKSVAVVGAGPAGLAAAFYLRRTGYAVTVFDDHPEPGGMLRYAIPAYRLPLSVLRRQLEALAGMGIRFECGRPVGAKDLALASLRKRFDAVFLATGTWREKRLGIAHEELLTPGLSFLSAIRAGRKPAVGERVLVIGGGSVAVDVAVSARRLGAREVSLACLEARDEMPAFPEDLALAIEEGIRLLPSFGPQRVLAEKGRLAGLELVRCTSVFDEERRFRPAFDPSTSREVAADQVLVAIGQGPDNRYAGAALVDSRGLLCIEPESGATALGGVFAGGDAVTGVGTVISAIGAGQRTARSIDEMLSGKKRRTEPEPTCAGQAIRCEPESLRPQPRLETQRRPAAERTLEDEDDATAPAEAAAREAKRCANCGCVAVSPSDLAPALIALGARMVTDRRVIPAEEFFAVRPRATTVLGDGEILRQVLLPPPPRGGRQRYQKFRLRNSIDFPIVGVASLVTQRAGRVREARLAFSAVAPTPIRARAAERFLRGRRLTEEVAEAAAAMAVQDAAPLAHNAFKVQVLRTLVRRALLDTAGAGDKRAKKTVPT
ncbi:MAG: FAD-dependent oxidoreductase [Myxococcales bacterium]|nr:FAD-dependent oxidoreductase [Myxococcales bacterium]